MHEASKDGILETKEFEKWCRDHYSKFFGLFTRINNAQLEKLKLIITYTKEQIKKNANAKM